MDGYDGFGGYGGFSTGEDINNRHALCMDK